MGTLPRKHLPPHRGTKLEVLGLEIARLKANSEHDVPIVATTSLDRINLFWWIGAWRSLQRQFHPFYSLTYSQTGIIGPVFAPLMQAPCSHRVGLAAGDGHVFLVYKRRIRTASGHLRTGLFIEVFLWDNAAHDKLKPLTQFPVKIPVSHMGLGEAGYYLWAGFSEPLKKLLILTQTFPSGDPSSPSLTLLGTGSYAQPQNLNQPQLWTLKQRIDDGGFDFDTWLQGENLHILYRRTGHALQIPMTVPELEAFQTLARTESRVPDLDGDGYEHLTFRTLKLPEANTQFLVERIPGGEHPQIQKTDPLLITTDRIEVGSVYIERFRLLPWGEGHIFVRPMVSRSRKVLLRQDANEWQTSLLMEIRDDVELRNQSKRVRSNEGFCFHSQFDELVSVPDINNETLHWVKPHGQLPVYMTRYGHVPALKALEIDLLHHDMLYDGLIVSRYRFPEGQMISEAQRVGFLVFDINHDLIPPHSSLQPSEAYENRQFSPFEVPRVVAPGWDVEPTLVLKRKYVDNTMGGALVVERGEGLEFAAYTDLGDGGARVIFDDSLPVPDAKYPEGKMMDPTTVEGSGSSADEEVLLVQTAEWEEYAMKPTSNLFEGGPMVSGLDGMIDTLFLAGGNELTLTVESTREFETNPFLSLSRSLASGETPIPAAAELSQSKLSFSYTQGDAAPDEQCVEVKNVGAGTLPHPTLVTYYPGETANWLIASVTSVDTYYRVCVKPEVTGLAPGNYEAAVIISARSTLMLVVHLDVKTVGPSVVLSTSTLNLSGPHNSSSPIEGAVGVTNGGGGNLGTLTTSITYPSDPSNWLRATVSGNSIRVEAIAASLSSGIYSATVRVSASGSSASFQTLFFVSVPAPSVATTPNNVSFERRYGHGNPNVEPVFISASQLPTPQIDNIQYISTPGNWIQAAVTRWDTGFRLWLQADMAQLLPGEHTATIEMSDRSSIAGSWQVPVTFVVEPPAPFAAFTYPSPIFPEIEVSFNAAPTEFWGYEDEDLAYSWEIVQLDENGNAIVTSTLGPLNTPAAHHTFDASTTREHPDHRVKLTVTAPDGVSKEIEERISVQASIWDSLWNFHEQFNPQEDGLYEIGNCSLAFSKFKLKYRVTTSGNPKSIKIERKEKYAAAYRFRAASRGQGQVDLMLPIEFRSKDVDVKGTAGAFFSVNEVKVDFSYGRPFTPGILTVDRRERTSFGGSTDTLKDHHSGLAAKPIGNSFHWMNLVKVEGGLRFAGHALLIFLSAIVACLTSLGFIALAGAIIAKEAAIAAALAIWPGGVFIAGLLTIALIAYVEWRVPRAIVSYIEKKILDQLAGSESTFREDSLDPSGLLTYAGEGLAEEIATRVLAQEDINGERGLNRVRHDFWQMIFVGNRMAKLLVRKSRR